MKKLLFLLPVLFTAVSCTTVVEDQKEPATISRETTTNVHSTPGYPPVQRSSTTTTVVQP